MADDTLPCNTGRSGYITISEGVQAHYARRGLWVGGEPIGALRDMLGRRVDYERPTAAAVFRVTPDQCEALARDIVAQPVYTSFRTSQQRAQFLRRIREAAGMPRGRNLLPVQSNLPERGLPGLARAPRMANPTPPAGVPFELARPIGGKAEKAFAEHVMKTVRDFVDYTQSSEFERGPA